jgi:hypothetical protein
MTRWASNTNETTAAQSSVYIVTLAKFEFDSGTLFVHDGVGPLVFDGDTYVGVGNYGSFDIVDENIDNVARGIRVSLSGVDPAIIPTVMTEIYQGRNATFYIAFLNDDMAFVANPEEVWAGRMDVMSISMDKNSATIELRCEYRLRKEPSVARYTDEDLRLQYSGDRFFDLLSKIPGYVSQWGDKRNSYKGGDFVPQPGIYEQER